MYDDPILTTYINSNKNAILEVTYDPDPELPIDNDDLPYRIYIDNLNTKSANQALINELFDGDNDKYMAYHDRFDNTIDFFHHIREIATPQSKTILPITKYEHSAVRYYLGTNSGWDTGTIGFAVIDSTNPSEIDNLSTDIENVLDRVTDYANGDVYSITEFSLNPIDKTKDNTIDDCDSIYACDFNYDNINDVVAMIAENPKNWHHAKTITTISYDIADDSHQY